MTIEIVDLPINSMVIFHSYVNVYQRVISHDFTMVCFPFRQEFTPLAMWIVAGLVSDSQLRWCHRQVAGGLYHGGCAKPQEDHGFSLVFVSWFR